jgi:hypothetical protein
MKPVGIEHRSRIGAAEYLVVDPRKAGIGHDPDSSVLLGRVITGSKLAVASMLPFFIASTAAALPPMPMIVASVG